MELLLVRSELWRCVNGIDEWTRVISVCADRQKFNLWILEFGHGQTYLGYTKCSLRIMLFKHNIHLHLMLLNNICFS